jgi:hypothetical protein
MEQRVEIGADPLLVASGQSANRQNVKSLRAPKPQNPVGTEEN